MAKLTFTSTLSTRLKVVLIEDNIKYLSPINILRYSDFKFGYNAHSKRFFILKNSLTANFNGNKFFIEVPEEFLRTLFKIPKLSRNIVELNNRSILPFSGVLEKKLFSIKIKEKLKTL